MTAIFRGTNLKRITVLALLALCAAQPVAAEFDVYGFAAARLGQADSTESWLEGGFGRFDNGADSGRDTESFTNLDVQVALDWHLSDAVLIHLHALGREEDALDDTDEIGLVEAFARWQVLDTDTHILSATAGLKFFPTSLENVDDLWQSRYTLTYSSWNSWIAHEFRPIGIELNYTYQFANGGRLGLIGNVFQGNDSSGAELAWGGWRQSQRLSTLGEVLPLPDLISLRPGNNFEDQRRDGSKPFGPDLDDDLGYAAQINYRTPDFRINLSYVANNGDRRLHRNEYAWDTEFTVLGLQYQINDNWIVLGEFADGSSGMGPVGFSVDIDFQTAYLLVSWNQEPHRVSARFETFEIDDTDGIVTDNSEDGDSFTLAYFYSPGAWRIGVEYIDTQVDRIAALQSGFDPNNDGQQLSLEVRYVF